MLPASMKNGIASRVKESHPVKMPETLLIMEYPPSTLRTRLLRRMLNAIGRWIRMQIRKIASKPSVPIKTS